MLLYIMHNIKIMIIFASHDLIIPSPKMIHEKRDKQNIFLLMNRNSSSQNEHSIHFEKMQS